MNIKKTCLALFGLSLCISISLAQISFGLLVLISLWRWPKENNIKEKLKQSAVTPLGLYVLWLFIAAFIHRDGATLDSVRALTSLFIYFFIVVMFDEKDVKSFLTWIVWGAVVAGLWGVIQKMGGIIFRPTEEILQFPDSWSHIPESILKLLALRNGRAVGPRSHPLTYAECLLPAFLVAGHYLYLQFKKEWNSIKSLYWFVGLTAIFGGLFFSESRAVLVALILSTLVYGALKGRQTFIYFLFIGGIVFSTLLTVAPHYRGRFLSIFSSAQGSHGDQLSKGTRLELWNQMLLQSKENPLTGVGKSGLRLATIDPILNLPRTWTETHNIFFQVLLESGVIGLGLFLWIWIYFLSRAWKMQQTLRPLFVSLLIGFIFSGLSESWILDKEVTMIFWSLMGCLEIGKTHEI